MSDVGMGAVRGAIGAMAMTGMRTFTADVGLLRETPPQSLAKKRRPTGVLSYVPKSRRRAAVELVHWSVGIAGGAIFGAVPHELRRASWFGPLYGLGILMSYDFGVAPLLGLKQSKRPKPAEQAALIADHLLYGFVLAGLKERARD
ncbi:MAG: hypothetical protein QOH90_2152 [Actinomycetota bacterium]|jgi:hypothetical protein|nr:hypothetical protein [Actinomycetota bacterium]